MNRLFDSSNPIMKALGKVFDIGWLGILYVLFCIPVITIGPATTALYYTSMKVLRKERGYVWSEFLGCIKTNFKTAAVLGIIMTLFYTLLTFNLYATVESGKYGGYLYGAYLGLLIILTCLNCYLYPLLSRFDLGVIKILRMALYLAFRHLLITIVLFAIVLMGFTGVYFSIIRDFPIIILLIPGGLSMIYTFPMEYIMKKYMPQSEPVIMDDGEIIKPWFED